MRVKAFIHWVFKNPWRVILAAFVSLFLSVYLAFLVLVSCLELVYEDVSPRNKGSAIFFSPVSLRGSDLKLLVRDYGGTNQPFYIAYVEASDANISFGNAVWSKDGTVIMAYTSRDANGDGLHPFGYDFQKHVKVNGPALNRLVIKRGGVGKQVFADANRWEQQCHHPWPWETYERR